MTYIFFSALVIIGILIFFVSIYFFKVKNIILRIQALNIINSLVVIFISIYCYHINKPEYIDMAILYVVITYLSSLVLNKYFIHLNNKE